MASMAAGNYEQVRFILDQQDGKYPFYCLLLYTPMNGLNARLHKYVISHWDTLDSLTGHNCLLVALEKIEPRISGRKIPLEQFKPEDVYKIARYMGATVDTIPGMIFFTEPLASGKTQILKLNEFLSDASSLTDEELTDFFQSVQVIVDRCCNPVKKGMTRIRQLLGLKTADQNLECLGKGLEKEWPHQSRWANVANKTSNWIVSSFTTTATVALAIDQIHSMLLHLLS